MVPSRAESHIQNTAPGPPATSAVATPAMFPVPKVAASAVQADWKAVVAPRLSPPLNAAPSVRPSQKHTPRS